MKSLLLTLSLAAPVWAADAPVTNVTPVTNVAPLPSSTKVVTPLATKSVFLAGLKEPQGMALDAEGNVLVCDYGAGEILKFGRDGKALGKLATGLKGPAQIVLFPTQYNDLGVATSFITYVTERKANRVIMVNREGAIVPLGNEIAQPLGLARGLDYGIDLLVVSHTTSKIYSWKSPPPPRLLLTPTLNGRRMITTPKSGPDPRLTPDPDQKWEPLYSAPSTSGRRYGFRWLTSDGGAFLMSDEVGERILMLTPSGRVATFASGISDPSGIVIGPDKTVYVANEGDGGQLIRLNAEGEKTVVAEGLGRPRGLVFVDDKTLLVSNRDGNVWRVVLP